MARPRVYDRDEITEKLNKYIDKTPVPILAEFCYKNNIIRQYLYEMGHDHEELSDAIKRCIEKKEAQLEILSLKGEVNASQAIFSLKQLGWKDKQDINMSGDMEININLSDDDAED